MNLEYCDKKCLVGVKKRTELLDSNNSAYDAALDFCFFVEECFKTCPYKDKHASAEQEQSRAAL